MINTYKELHKFCTQNENKNIIPINEITISVKISDKRYLIFHKTLIDNYVDLSIRFNNNTITNFMSMPVHIAYQLICLYK